MPSASTVCTAAAALAGGVAIGVLYGDKIKRLLKGPAKLPPDTKEVPVTGDDKKDFLAVFKVRCCPPALRLGVWRAAPARTTDRSCAVCVLLSSRAGRRSPRRCSHRSRRIRSRRAPPSTSST